MTRETQGTRRSGERVGVAVVGAGYWGPHLARNFQASSGFRLITVCDAEATRAKAVAAPWEGVESCTDLEAVLADDRIQAVAVATPVHTHAELVLRALAAGRHVLVEKPLAGTVSAATAMAQAAEDAALVLMVDHTYCYTPAVRLIRQMVEQGELGEVLYVDAVRINLGLVQSDVDVFWDLAPHDLSIMDRVLPGGLHPDTVRAHGADPLHVGLACVGHLDLSFPGEVSAHAHLNWLSPTKIRSFVVGGSRRTLVWDDLNPHQRVSVFDRGVDLEPPSARRQHQAKVSYRWGDMLSPALPDEEPLAGVVDQFFRSIVDGEASPTGARAALRVVEVLEGVAESAAHGGAAVRLAGTRVAS